MNMPLLIGIIIAVTIIYAIVNAVEKARNPIKKSVFGIITGFAALIVVNLLSPLTGVGVPISVLSVLVASVAGLPGVTLILALNAFF